MLVRSLPCCAVNTRFRSGGDQLRARASPAPGYSSVAYVVCGRLPEPEASLCGLVWSKTNAMPLGLIVPATAHEFIRYYKLYLRRRKHTRRKKSFDGRIKSERRTHELLNLIKRSTSRERQSRNCGENKRGEITKRG